MGEVVRSSERKVRSLKKILLSIHDVHLSLHGSIISMLVGWAKCPQLELEPAILCEALEQVSVRRCLNSFFFFFFSSGRDEGADLVI